MLVSINGNCISKSILHAITYLVTEVRSIEKEFLRLKIFLIDASFTIT